MINRGWARAGITLKTFFVSLTTALAFVSLFPLIFKQQDNFNQNMAYYENYTKGELEIFNQLSGLRNPLLERGDTLDNIKKHHAFFHSTKHYRHLDSLLIHDNNVISNLTNYVLTIDPSQVKSIGDIYKFIENTSKASNDTLR